MTDRAKAMLRYAEWMDKYYSWDVDDANDTDMDNITFIIATDAPEDALEFIKDCRKDFDGAEELAEIDGIIADLEKICA